MSSTIRKRWLKAFPRGPVDFVAIGADHSTEEAVLQEMRNTDMKYKNQHTEHNLGCQVLKIEEKEYLSYPGMFFLCYGLGC